MDPAEDYRQELTSRGAAAPMATFKQIWDAEFARAGLDTFGGVGKPLLDAYDELQAGVETAHGGKTLGELARERNLPLLESWDARVKTLGALVDELPEEERKPLEPLKDVRKRAAEKAALIEKQAADVNAGTYGLSGTGWAFLASASRTAIDPANIGAGILTAPIGGPFAGPVLGVIGRQAAAAAVAQAVVTPEIQRQRRELGLEAGFGEGVRSIVEAGIGGGAIAGGIRGLGGIFRLAHNRLGGEIVVAPAGRPPSVPPAEAPPAPAIARPGEVPTPPAPAAPAVAPTAAAAVQPDLFAPAAARVDPLVSREDVAAAAALHHRDQLIYDLPAQTQTAGGREFHAAKVNEAADAMELGRPQQPIVQAGDAPGMRPRATSAEPDVMIGNVGPIPFAPNFAPRLVQYVDGDVQQLIRPSGDRVTVHPMVVELGDIIASHDLEGRANPAYPLELQPRDRAAPASRTWVAEKGAALEPELLGRAPTTGLGAPIIGPDGVVESGNGRALLLMQAYARHPERIAAYRRFLEDQGYDLAMYEEPVLVRMREGDIPMAERARLALEANVSATAGMSARERAFADAKQLDENLLAAYVPGDVQSAANTKFVRAFADRTVAPEERPQFIGADNRISAEGVRRIEAALVARAWEAPDIVSALYESADPSSKAILGAFADTAPMVARLRAAVEEGRVAASDDPTPALLEAFRLVERSRAGGPKLAELIYQIDIERGAVPEDVAAAVRLYYRDAELTRAAGRDAVAERISKAVNRAIEQQNVVGDLFQTSIDKTAALHEAQLAGQPATELPVAGPGRAELQRKVDNKAPMAEIRSDPVIVAAMEQAEKLPRTDKQPGFGTPGYEARREFVFDGERVVGYEAAISRLIDKARSYAEGPVVAERQALVILGQPASGKSGIAEAYARARGAAIVDSDDAKPTMPEYAGGIGAPAVHGESSLLASRVATELAKDGSNLVFPRVGPKVADIRLMIEELRALGYQVDLVHMEVETEEAYRRMVDRYLKKLRIISADYFEGVDGNPKKTYLSIKEEGLVRETAEIDNNARLPRFTEGDPGLVRQFQQGMERPGRPVGGLPPSGAAEGAGGPGGRGQAAAAGEEVAAAAERRITQPGDPALRLDAQRALEDGDFEITLSNPDGTTRSVSAERALAELGEDANAQAEFIACVGVELEAE